MRNPGTFVNFLVNITPNAKVTDFLQNCKESFNSTRFLFIVGIPVALLSTGLARVLPTPKASG
jgi:hypothetical protein